MPDTVGPTYRTARIAITNVVQNFIDPFTNIAEAKAIVLRGFNLDNNDAVQKGFLKLFSKRAADVVLATDEPDEVYDLVSGNNERPIERKLYVHKATASFAVTLEKTAGATALGSSATGWLDFGREDG